MSDIQHATDATFEELVLLAAEQNRLPRSSATGPGRATSGPPLP